MSTSAEPGPDRRALTVLLASAALALVCAIGFPLAPVTQPVVTASWPDSPTATSTALPLMPYQPVAFRATITCDAARSVPVGAPVLATVPPDSPDGALGGLRVTSSGGALTITSNDTRLTGLAGAPLPPGPCTVTVDSRPEATTVSVDGRPVATDDRDVRPVVAGVFTAAPTTAGLAVDLRTDTRFQTTPSGLKWALGTGCVLGLVGLLAAAVVLDGPRRPAGRRARRRPRVVDVAVGAGLVVWAVVGPATVDDGYISGILRGRGENGFTGNVYRWLNAPEAPFSWFYEVVRAWAALAPGPAASVLWLRVPATVLGMISWLLVTRHVLPRLGPALRRPGVGWIAALVFGAWWLPFGLSLRPEPWVAAGVLGVWVATERAVATRRLLPLVVAAALAGLTVALTPGALAGLVPLLVALPALVRGVRRAPGAAVGALPRLAAVVGALAVAVVPMAADQGLAGLLEATRVRQVIGGGQPWYDEIERYTQLLTPGSIQGGLGARAPVLLLLVALVAVTWTVLGRRVRLGVAPAPTARLLATTALSLLLLTVSPTKWTLHFGEFAGLGTAVVTLFIITWSAAGLRALARTDTPGRPGSGWAALGVLVAVVVATALVLVGHNQWAYAADWGVFWNDIPPQVLRVPLSDVALYGGAVVLVVLAVVLAIRGGSTSADAGRADVGRVGLPRWAAPGAVALVLVVAVVALQGLSFVKVTVDRAGTFTFGGDSLAALGGHPCGLAPDLSVETDPVAGLLPAGPPSAPDPGRPFLPTAVAAPTVPLTAAGRELDGWTAPPAEDGDGAALRTGWFAVPDTARSHEAPVVVTVSGSQARAGVTLEYSTAEVPGAEPTSSVTPNGPADGTAARDLRADAPTDARWVRVTATDAARSDRAAAGTSPTGTTADTPLAVSRPRVPRTVPFDRIVPPGSTALADWPVALLFGCLHPPALTSGLAEIPPWRLTPPGNADAGEIAVSPTTGGPFATARLLVDEQRFGVYLRGDPVRDPVGLVRWVPRTALTSADVRTGAETVPGWAQTGRATVPVLDTP